jgi:hypothetical protein
MTGITLTTEEIRTAPAPVRQWIEQQVMASLGMVPPAAVTPPPQAAHLVACSLRDAEAILTEIEGQMSVVNVFFEFGRSMMCYGQPPVMVFRLLDIQYHTRLQEVGQVIASLDVINKTLARIRQDDSVRFCAFDNNGHCLIPPQTQQSIATLWQRMMENQRPADDKAERAPTAAE